MNTPRKSPFFVPWLIAASLILFACFLEVFLPKVALNFGLWTYNPRVKFASWFGQDRSRVATNLGFVVITDRTIEAVNNGSLGYRYGLYWPRHVYGRALEELTAEGAEVVAFDVLFKELRSDHEPVELTNGQKVASDEYFARALRQSGRAILSADKGLMPAPLFATNAMTVGSIAVNRDSWDGVLRRDVPFYDFKVWHPLMLRLSAEGGCDLTEATFVTNTVEVFSMNGDRMVTNHATLKKLRLRRELAEDTPDDPKYWELPLDSQGRISVKKSFPKEWLTEGTADRIEPFTIHRAWSVGIVMAAHELGLDLSRSVMDTNQHRLILSGTNGVRREIPLDDSGSYYIDWRIRLEDDVLAKGSFEELLVARKMRDDGETIETNRWKGKLVLIGSVATGNDLSDLGSTPLSSHSYLASKHWNVANSIINNCFVTVCPLWGKLVLILIFGGVSAWITLKIRPIIGLGLIFLIFLLYTLLAFWVYARFLFWLPLGVPMLISLLGTFLLIAPYRVRVEQAEQKRVKSAFSKVLAPKIVNELLTQNVKFGGTRRELTVFFADVRGFTELTDSTQTRAEEYVRQNHLTGKEAEAYFDSQAQLVLQMVSQCLGLIAETIKRHDGTLDKYIGDCVMAFWGAPTADPQHALHCVRAAIESQRALHSLNDERVRENQRIEEENKELVAAGKPPKPLQSLISLGTGINTGVSIAGFMGSDKDILNYTVFGREINLASRLEGVSGHGRIVIGEGTYLALKRDAPELAATCIELPPVKVKGFRHEVRAYEVPWREKSPINL
jgi:class 3 adenylate cyclase/CHASE2 domain-containing sensor protein